jgi:hypothetical protein
MASVISTPLHSMRLQQSCQALRRRSPLLINDFQQARSFRRREAGCFTRVPMPEEQPGARQQCEPDTPESLAKPTRSSAPAAAAG